MNTLTIELTAKELEAIARITGTLLGYAVPDRYCEREVIVKIFNVASEKLSDVLVGMARNAPSAVAQMNAFVPR